MIARSTSSPDHLPNLPQEAPRVVIQVIEARKS
jgi:hypothetical protein